MAGNTWLSGEGAPQKPKEQAAARGHQLLCRSAGRDELSSQRRINARFFAQGYTGFHRKRERDLLPRERGRNILATD